jgi:hypothetical protein
MLLCMRMCDPGDVVTVMQHIAGRGSPSQTAAWPFGLDIAEQVTPTPDPGHGRAPGPRSLTRRSLTRRTMTVES